MEDIESLGARDQVDVRDGPKEEWEFSDIAGETPRVVWLFRRNREGACDGLRGGATGGAIAVELLDKLVVRCREANVDPNNVEVFMGPDTERLLEILDTRLADRLVGSCEDVDRLDFTLGTGGASIFPFGWRDDTERLE
jgi:hypothetical protein